MESFSPVWQAFRPEVRAYFVDRPNRFVVRAEVAGQVVEAHCPNPGRLSELLFPGVSLTLERAAEGRKMAYTAVAVEHSSGAVVPLASVRANPAVGALVLSRWFPRATVVKSEVSWGKSRFDWMVEEAGVTHLIEVKACSEVEFGTALFPDAPSPRAIKHLEELAEAAGTGVVPHVVFAVVHGRPRYWAPNFHTDPDFARTLMHLAPRLKIHAVVMETRPDGTTRLVDDALTIRLPAEVPDQGLCLTVGPGPEYQVQALVVEKDLTRQTARFPARRTFAVAGDRNPKGWEPWTQKTWTSDPCQDREFLNAVMAARHRDF